MNLTDHFVARLKFNDFDGFHFRWLKIQMSEVQFEPLKVDANEPDEHLHLSGCSGTKVNCQFIFKRPSSLRHLNRPDMVLLAVRLDI